MPERARAVVLASTATGDIIPDATVTVRQSGTTNLITETIYANDDPDTTQLTNGVFKTDARGLAIFYLTNQKRVDVLFTKAGVTSVTIPVDVQKSSLVSGESVATSTIWDAAGDLAKGTGADTAARLARGTANQVLRTNAGGTDIEWGVEQARDVITTAGDLTYGTAADTVARLGIGTAGQVLKVNSGATAPEWGAAAAVGDLLDWQFVRTTSDQALTTSSTTFQDITGLSFSIAANEVWEFEFVVGATAASTTPDLKATVVGPAGCSGRQFAQGPAVANTGRVGDGDWISHTNFAGGNWGDFGLSTDEQGVVVKGVIVNGATAGTFKLQGAQNTSSADAVTIKANSYGKASRVV